MSVYWFLFVLFLLRAHLSYASSRGFGAVRREYSLDLQKAPLHALKGREREPDDTRGLAVNRRLKMMKPCTTEPREGIKCSFDGDVPNSRIMLESKQLVETTRQKMKSVEGRSTRETRPQNYEEVRDSNGDERAGEDVEVKDYAQPTRKPPIHNQRS